MIKKGCFIVKIYKTCKHAGVIILIYNGCKMGKFKIFCNLKVKNNAQIVIKKGE